MRKANLALFDKPQFPSPPASTPLRDWVAVGFRRRRLMVASFLVIFLSVLLLTWLMPAQYEAQIKILVKRERVDPVVSPGSNTQLVPQPDVAETDLNSEVELLNSRDLLEKVVVENRLDKRFKLSLLSLALATLAGQVKQSASGQDMQFLRAVWSLEQNLKVEPLKKTKLIKVSYLSRDPQLSVAVLQTLLRLYLEKHLEVHRLPGALAFFQDQTEQYRQRLADAEGRLTEFGDESQITAPALEKEITIRKQSDFEAELQHTQAAFSETKRRIADLERQAASMPPRLTTQVRVSDNPYLLQQMKGKLLDLENERTKLLSKYEPEYRPVQEIEAQVAQTRQALAAAENSPTREETTDRDGTYEWVKGELAKARTELTALAARSVALAKAANTYRDQARRLSDTEIVQQGLIRAAKTAEEDYLLYSHKQEEARISDALDQQRIVNVAVAEQATVPAVPASPNWPLNLSLGWLLGCLFSIGLALTADYLDHSFRTPGEVETFLNVPVLAAFPQTGLFASSSLSLRGGNRHD